MSSIRPDDRVLPAFLRVIANVIVNNQRVAEQLGLGMTDMQFLNHLQQHGPLTPGRLAQLTDLSTGTVTGVLDRLERAGFARRERHPDDRRKVVVSLDQERLQREVAPLYADQARHLEGVLAGFDASELDVIARFLEQLAPPR